MTSQDSHHALAALWRIESPRVVAALSRMVRDLGVAEELAQDALVAALESWPRTGVPEKPGAWLMLAAKRRAIDHLRRSRLHARKHEQLGRELESYRGNDEHLTEGRLEDPDGDLLRLVFVACHPVLSKEARVALTLRVLGGLATDEIARAFLVPESTIAQRIVRAKRALREAGVEFEMPVGEERRARLESVLEVVYLIFNEGYSATAGDDWMRPALCEDAQRLARVLTELLPEEPEAHGLAALLELQSSRAPARLGPAGEPILLLDQDRSRWDPLLIRRGLDSLARAQRSGEAGGPYAIQAAIAAAHARARVPDETDWPRIVVLYDALARVRPSPIVELNRAVAVSMAFGPQAGLELVDRLLQERVLDRYHLLPAVRGDLLLKLGRAAEARAEFTRAASLTRNRRERILLLERAAACSPERAVSS